jgi:hypothetical protein
MRITQAYMSNSVNDFNLLNRLNLKNYYDSSEPCLFFGVYSNEDIQAIKNHNSIAIIFWCGYDTMLWDNFDLFKKDSIVNLTVSKEMQKRLNSFNLKTKLVHGIVLDENIYQKKTGDKIFAYCPWVSFDYHRMDIISELQLKYDVILGDGKFTQKEWHEGAKYEIYNQCYIGLVLNNYAGGGATILELALQGKYCITNTQDYDNCLSWNTIEDIENHINNPKFKLLNENLINFNQFCNFEPEWLYIN